MRAVKHACPEAYFPSEAPACGFVATVGQRLLGCSEELVVAEGRNLVRREQPVEVRDVAVLLLAASLCVRQVRPLLQLLTTAYLHRRYLVERLFQFGNIVSIFA